MFFQRHILEKIEKSVKRKEIIAIVGARQIGKTTIMEYFYDKLKTKNSNFISFDDLDELKLFEEQTNIFIEKYVEGKDYLFIDEIQYSKNSGRILKLIFDKYKIKIFISGSSKSEIAVSSLKDLVGRVFIFLCFPLSFEEKILNLNNKNYFLLEKKRSFQDFNLINKNFEEYLTFGGYPEVLLENDKKLKKEILRNIKNTYLLKEIKDILNYQNLSEFENVLKFLSINDGKIVNKNTISNNFGIHNNRVREIIDVLEKTSILYVVRPYLRNKSKEIIKSPKTYLFDLGFKNSILENFNGLNLRGDKGEIYENFILNSLVKSGFSVKYWNYKNLSEVDFVVEEGDNLFGFEIKSRLKDSKISNSVKRFIEDNKPKKVFVLCENFDGKNKYLGCEVIFMNYLNIFWIIKNYLSDKKR